MAVTEEEPIPASIQMVATCHTVVPEVCPVNGIPFTGTYYANATEPIYRGVCMQCGQNITDLVPV
jgi:hypothetical protein